MTENPQVGAGVPVSPGVPQVSPGDVGKAPSCVPRGTVSAPRRSRKGDTGAAGPGDTETGPTRGGHPPQTLYRFFSGDLLLYVGITERGWRRFREHSKDKQWWREVTTVTVEHFDTRAELEAAEIAAIRAEQPRYNVVHNVGPSTEQIDDAAMSFARRLANDRDRRLDSVTTTGGRFAVWAECNGSTSVSYWPDATAARGALEWIDRIGCGGRCTRRHWMQRLPR